MCVKKFLKIGLANPYFLGTHSNDSLNWVDTENAVTA